MAAQQDQTIKATLSAMSADFPGFASFATANDTRSQAEISDKRLGSWGGWEPTTACSNPGCHRLQGLGQ